MLKLKLWYSGHLMQRTDSSEMSWCWILKAGGEVDDGGWDGWMVSLTQWTWVWASFRSWWWTGKPDVLQSMGLQSVRHDWATEMTDWLKLEIARVNPDILGINKLKWTGMGKLILNDHYIYYNRKSPLEEMEYPHSQQKSLKCSTWMKPQKQQNDLFISKANHSKSH